MFFSEAAIPDLVSKPVRRVDTRNLSFNRLPESDEVAALLKIHPKTLQEMSPDGEMTAQQVGRMWRFCASVLNHWLEHKMRVEEAQVLQ